MCDCSTPEHVTEAMVAAGNRMAAELLHANIAKNMDGLGGSSTMDEMLAGDLLERDLVLSYIDGRIDSTAAIYLAMRRRWVAEQGDAT